LLAYVVPKRKVKKVGPGGYPLPNGMVIRQQNKGETDFLYKEIFETEMYTRHGIELPEDACIFDVGANIGLFALHASEHCPRGRVYAFEPLPPIVESLRENAQLCDAQVRVFALGLSNQEGIAEFTYYAGNSIMSSLSTFASAEEDIEVVRKFVGNQRGVSGIGESTSKEVEALIQERMKSEKYQCQLRRLSDVMREESVEHIDLLKVDVERAEWNVLQGIDAGDWKKIDQIVLEVHDRVRGQEGSGVETIIALLQHHEYEVTVEEDEAMKGTGLYNVYARRGPRSANDEAMLPELRESRAVITPPVLRTYLRQKLPEYMVPIAFVLLNELPLTANGKLDRKALPAPEGDAYAVRQYQAPQGAVEELLAGIWAKLLNLERVGRQDNFFELGGHSLLAVRVIARVREALKVEVATRDLFVWPILQDFASRLAIAGPPEPGEHAPLPVAQQPLWFLSMEV
jgi:FkbM family methyltransferase